MCMCVHACTCVWASTGRLDLEVGYCVVLSTENKFQPSVRGRNKHFSLLSHLSGLQRLILKRDKGSLVADHLIWNGRVSLSEIKVFKTFSPHILFGKCIQHNDKAQAWNTLKNTKAWENYTVQNRDRKKKKKEVKLSVPCWPAWVKATKSQCSLTKACQPQVKCPKVLDIIPVRDWTSTCTNCQCTAKATHKLS